FFSMSLRGSIFLPLAIALLFPKVLPPIWAIPAMIISAFFAITSKSLFNIPIPPLFVAFIASAVIVTLGMTVGRKYDYRIRKQIAALRQRLLHSSSGSN
ncbi:MAG: hypothetical protein J6P43_02860, partial [Succinivibrionaceae bacterium]|nr:hypothetical protein [Succinivibrionaceae bacterium]